MQAIFNIWEMSMNFFFQKYIMRWYLMTLLDFYYILSWRDVCFLCNLLKMFFILSHLQINCLINFDIVIVRSSCAYLFFKHELTDVLSQLEIVKWKRNKLAFYHGSFNVFVVKYKINVKWINYWMFYKKIYCCNNEYLIWIYHWLFWEKTIQLGNLLNINGSILNN